MCYDFRDIVRARYPLALAAMLFDRALVRVGQSSLLRTPTYCVFSPDQRDRGSSTNKVTS